MRRRLFWLAPAALAAVTGGLLLHRPAATAPKADGAADPAATLPISRVVLFSSGVGYFQRTGDVEGNARVDLTFQVRDINDLIKSMVVQDDKGLVSAVSYDSLDPVERTLKSFAVNLTGSPTFSQILGQLRGEKVEVVLQQTAAGQPGTVTGAVLGLERQKVPSKDGAVDVDVLNLWCAEGVRAVKLGEVQRLRFLNPAIESEFRRALDTLALSHDAQKKAVSLNFAGEGKRQVRVGYVVENPIWKTSYRLVLDKDEKPFLQGWAVVDNPTDDDWTGVGMALISGRPVSFQMDLYQPLYVPRPMVEMELFQSLRPVAYGGAVERFKATELAAGKPTDGPVGGGRANARRGAAPGAAGGFGGGMGGGPGGPGAPAADGASLGAEQRKQFVEEMDKSLKSRMDLTRGIQSAAAASQLGDFFQYTINTPVTLPRQKSALLPIVNKPVDATRLSIYNPAVHAKFPMLGLKLKNSSGLHLMQGPITVFEGSTYAGDARVQDLPPNDDRLISYAVDLGTEVEAKAKNPRQHLTAVRIERGLLHRTDRLREEMTYTATNRSGQARTLWVEHPYRAEFELVSKEQPVERTPEVRRFELKLPAEAKASVSMTVVEERDIGSQVSIANTDDNTIRFFLNSTVASAEVKAALQGAVERKNKLATVQQELAQVNRSLQVISEDQSRLRANLREMPSTAAAYKRYLAKFDKQETEIEGLQEKQKKLQADELAARQALDSYLLSLNVK